VQQSLKVRDEKNEQLACAVAAEEVVALAWAGHLDPTGKVLLLLFWFLSEKIVGDAQRQLAAFVESLDDRVILRVILESATRLDAARKATAIQFTHKVAC